MNVVFISPHFPPQFFHFAVALRERGVNVLGLGDAPPHELRPELQWALGEYYYAPRLDDYEAARRALGYFVWKHGRIDRIDSHNEHWLMLEAQLRDDFNVPGPRGAEMAVKRSKIGMASLFRQANVTCPDGELWQSPDQVRGLADRWGFPLVFKPDQGVGASRTFKVSSWEELEKALREPLAGYVVQPFVQGDITSYDGLVDREGRIVFETSHIYNAGVMDIVNAQLDLYYWNRREIPPALETLGRRVIEAFGIRERFFHIEFFEKDGQYSALEVNIRPPGGFTTDMMNYSADIDVYRLWARVVTGDSLADFKYERKYHVAHVSRRWNRPYRHTPGEIANVLGARLLVHHHMPRAFAGAMGDEAFLVRDHLFEGILSAVRLIQS